MLDRGAHSKSGVTALPVGEGHSFRRGAGGPVAREIIDRLAAERILLQGDSLGVDAFRGTRFADPPVPLVGNNDLLTPAAPTCGSTERACDRGCIV